MMAMARREAKPRCDGVARALLNEGLQWMQHQFPDQAIRIAAQCYLQSFYEDFGFVVCSAMYDEDGIAHIDMVRAGSAG